MLKKLSEFLPLSRRKYMKGIEAITIVLQGLTETEANHCQIETNIIQQLQQLHQNKKDKPASKKSNKDGSDPAFA